MFNVVHLQFKTLNKNQLCIKKLFAKFAKYICNTTLSSTYQGTLRLTDTLHAVDNNLQKLMIQGSQARDTRKCSAKLIKR